MPNQETLAESPYGQLLEAPQLESKPVLSAKVMTILERLKSTKAQPSIPTQIDFSLTDERDPHNTVYSSKSLLHAKKFNPCQDIVLINTAEKSDATVDINGSTNHRATANLIETKGQIDKNFRNAASDQNIANLAGQHMDGRNERKRKISDTLYDKSRDTSTYQYAGKEIIELSSSDDDVQELHTNYKDRVTEADVIELHDNSNLIVASKKNINEEDVVELHTVKKNVADTTKEIDCFGMVNAFLFGEVPGVGSDKLNLTCRWEQTSFQVFPSPNGVNLIKVILLI